MSAPVPEPVDAWRGGFDRYLLAAGVRSAHSRRGYARQVQRFLESGDALLDWATDELVEVPAGTACVLKSALRHWCHHTHQEAPTFPRGARRQREVRFPLGDAELRTFYARVRHHPDLPPGVRTVLSLLPRTGLRIAEVCQLRAADRVRDQGVPALRVDRGRGKGGHGRLIPLTDEAGRLLETYMTAHRPGLKGDAPLFPGLVPGSEHLSPSTVREHLRQLRGENERWTPHVLRHTFATRFYHAGGDLLELMEILGHTSLETTRQYVKGSAARKRATMEAAELPKPRASKTKPGKRATKARKGK